MSTILAGIEVTDIEVKIDMNKYIQMLTSRITDVERKIRLIAPDIPSQVIYPAKVCKREGQHASQNPNLTDLKIDINKYLQILTLRLTDVERKLRIIEKK